MRDLESLKELYRVARKTHVDKFKYNGSFISTGYAKYLIEFLENKKGRKDEK